MNIDNTRLQKVNLGPDWIDLSYGEPTIVAAAMVRQLNCVATKFKMPAMHDLLTWTYQPAAGKPDLVKILEDKYGVNVVVTNGAKQAISAAMYAFKRSGVKSIYWPRPFYPSNVSLAEAVVLPWDTEESSAGRIIASPNNPDGVNTPNADLIGFKYEKPLIHDAAYYTEIYLPDGEIPIPLGDVQIFSMSKMYGISGLRVGYAVCHNPKYYKDIVSYVETATAGVSAASQDIARNIEMFFRDNPDKLTAFHQEARQSIKDAREEFSKIDPEVLEILPCQSNSMFMWCKIGPKLNYKDAKVYILEGTLFGQPGYARVNIAYPLETIREAVNRLNKFKS